MVLQLFMSRSPYWNCKLLLSRESFSIIFVFSSVQLLSRVQLFVTPWTAAHQASLFITNSPPGIYSNSCPLSRWCHPTISSSVVSLSSHLQSFPASGSFQMSQFFASGGQSIGASASASVLAMNTQDWFPLGWTGWIFLQSKGQESSPTPQFKSINFLVLSFLLFIYFFYFLFYYYYFIYFNIFYQLFL